MVASPPKSNTPIAAIREVVGRPFNLGAGAEVDGRTGGGDSNVGFEDRFARTSDSNSSTPGAMAAAMQRKETGMRVFNRGQINAQDRAMPKDGLGSRTQGDGRLQTDTTTTKALKSDSLSERLASQDQAVNHSRPTLESAQNARRAFNTDGNVASLQARTQQLVTDRPNERIVAQVPTWRGLGDYEPLAGRERAKIEAQRRELSRKTFRIQHEGITIHVKELNAFKDGFPRSEIATHLKRAAKEKNEYDSKAYPKAIAQHLYENGTGAFDRALNQYNQETGKNISPPAKPEWSKGRKSDGTTLGDRVKLVEKLLKDDPNLTSHVLREMAEDEGYFNSKTHIAWSKAAEARTSGKIPAEWWREFDPYGGTAGNGPSIKPTGKYPGPLSRIAMGHDTDWSLGRFFGVGPMSKLRGAEGFTPEQLGWVGLRPDPRGYFSGIDMYTDTHPDWHVE